VDAQMRDVATHMKVLDDFVTKARSQNGQHREWYLNNLQGLTANVRQSYANLHGQLADVNGLSHTFEDDVTQHNNAVRESIEALEGDVRKPLAELLATVQDASFTEYKVTGSTPPKTTYMYPMTLPKTETHGTLIAKLRPLKQPALSPLGDGDLKPLLGSPSKTRVYNDIEDEVGTLPPATTTITSSNTGLREVDVNVVARPPSFNAGSHGMDSSISTASKADCEKNTSVEKDDMTPLPRKRRLSSSSTTESKLPQKVITRRMAGILEGRENAPLPTGGLNGRRLRSRPSN
jgi:kinesin family member 11